LDIQAREKLSKARTHVMITHFALGPLTMKLDPVEDYSHPTMWTNGVQLGYNPNFVNEITQKHLIMAVIHEDWHPALGHHTRRGDRDPGLWNQAGDYVINLILVEMGYLLLDGMLYDQRFRGMSTEDVYAILEAEKKAEEQKQEEQQKSDETDESEPEKSDETDQSDDDQSTDQKGDESDDQSDESDESNELDEEENQSDSNDENQSELGQNGSDQTGDDQSEEEGKGDSESSESSESGQDQPNYDKSQLGEVRDYPGDPDETERNNQEWQMAVAQAKELAEKVGDLPGGISRIMDDIIDPVMPWKELLRPYIEKIFDGDYNWMKPNKRYSAYHNVIIPSMESDGIKILAIFNDSSGSRTNKNMAEAESEINSVLVDFPDAIVLVVHCDTQIHTEIFTY